MLSRAPILLLSLLSACASTDAPEYRLKSASGVPMSRAEAEVAHAKAVGSHSIVTGLDSPLKAISTPFPEYPPSLRTEATVHVRFVIEADGTVSNPSIQGSPPPALAAITLNSIMRWRFEPPKRAGLPVRVNADQEFTFGLK